MTVAAGTGWWARESLDFLLVTWLLVVIVIAVLPWGEFEHWRSSRRRMGTRPGESGTG